MDFIKKNKIKIIFCLAFIILFSSYSFNIFKISDDNYRFFDRGDESNIISRLLMSRNEGLLSKGGLTGSYSFYKYNLPDDDSTLPNILSLVPDGDVTRYEEADINLIGPMTAQRYDDYINDRDIYDGEWLPYKTQPGGQAMVYGVLDKVLPINSNAKLLLFRSITIALSALVFILFCYWIHRNFGIIPAIITFLLILVSPYFFRFAYNLWWTLWSYYIPFIVMLFALDYRIKKPDKMTDSKLFAILFISVFLKFFFTGAEFITSTLVMSMCPIIYYLIYKRDSIKYSAIFFLKSSIVCIASVIVGFGLLIAQIRALEGTWAAGIEHIILSFTKRSIASEQMIDDISIIDVIVLYLGGEAFYWESLPNFSIGFGMSALIVTIASVILYYLNKKVTNKENQNRNTALIITTSISIIAPFSWVCIFAEHAVTHYMIDYITWYMPYLLYGYLIIAITIDLSVRRLRK